MQFARWIFSPGVILFLVKAEEGPEDSNSFHFCSDFGETSSEQYSAMTHFFTLVFWQEQYLVSLTQVRIIDLPCACCPAWVT